MTYSEKTLIVSCVCIFIIGFIFGVVFLYGFTVTEREFTGHELSNRIEHLMANPDIFRYDLVKDLKVDNALKLYFSYSGMGRTTGQSKQILSGVMYNLCYGSEKDLGEIDIGNMSVPAVKSVNCLLSCLEIAEAEK